MATTAARLDATSRDCDRMLRLHLRLIWMTGRLGQRLIPVAPVLVIALTFIAARSYAHLMTPLVRDGLGWHG